MPTRSPPAWGPTRSPLAPPRHSNRSAPRRGRRVQGRLSAPEPGAPSRQAVSGPARKPRAHDVPPRCGVGMADSPATVGEVKCFGLGNMGDPQRRAEPLWVHLWHSGTVPRCLALYCVHSECQRLGTAPLYNRSSLLARTRISGNCPLDPVMTKRGNVRPPDHKFWTVSQWRTAVRAIRRYVHSMARLTLMPANRGQLPADPGRRQLIALIHSLISYTSRSLCNTSSQLRARKVAQ